MDENTRFENERHESICSWLNAKKKAHLNYSSLSTQNYKKRCNEGDNSCDNNFPSSSINNRLSRDEMSKSVDETNKTSDSHTLHQDKRKIANRKYAKASYFRKKKKVEDLKHTVRILKGENLRLEEEQNVIKSQIKYWEEQIMNIENSSSSSDAENSPSSSSKKICS